MRFFHSSSSHNSLLLLFKPPAGNNKSSEVWIVSSPKYTPFDDGVTTVLSPTEVYFWFITTTVDKLIISSPPLKGISFECKLKITLSNNFMEIWMGGGTLHLKVLRRWGGGAQAVLEIWVESGWVGGWEGGGKKIGPFGGVGGMDFCWNNPLSQTVLQEEMINQHNIMLLQISTVWLCTFPVVL